VLSPTKEGWATKDYFRDPLWASNLGGVIRRPFRVRGKGGDDVFLPIDQCRSAHPFVTSDEKRWNIGYAASLRIEYGKRKGGGGGNP